MTSTVCLSVSTGLKRGSVSVSIFTLSGIDRKEDVGPSLSSTLALDLDWTKGVTVSSLFPSFILDLNRTCEFSASSTFSSLGSDRRKNKSHLRRHCYARDPYPSASWPSGISGRPVRERIPPLRALLRSL